MTSKKDTKKMNNKQVNVKINNNINNKKEEDDVYIDYDVIYEMEGRAEEEMVNEVVSFFLTPQNLEVKFSVWDREHNTYSAVLKKVFYSPFEKKNKEFDYILMFKYKIEDGKFKTDERIISPNLLKDVTWVVPKEIINNFLATNKRDVQYIARYKNRMGY